MLNKTILHKNGVTMMEQTDEQEITPDMTYDNTPKDTTESVSVDESPQEIIAEGIKSGEFMSDEEKAKLKSYDKYFTKKGKSRLNDSMKWGYCVGLGVAAVIMIVRVILSSSAKFPYEIFVIIWSMFAATSGVQATAYKNKKYRIIMIIVSISETLCAILFLVLWILQLCNRL
jgi:hypothetical protein